VLRHLGCEGYDLIIARKIHSDESGRSALSHEIGGDRLAPRPISVTDDDPHPVRSEAACGGLAYTACTARDNNKAGFK
jgi:hypothetical protein